LHTRWTHRLEIVKTLQFFKNIEVNGSN